MLCSQIRIYVGFVKHAFHDVIPGMVRRPGSWSLTSTNSTAPESKKNRIKGGMQQWKIRPDVYKKREKEEKEGRQVRMKKSREIQKEGKSEKRGREMENGRETVKKERLERR